MSRRLPRRESDALPDHHEPFSGVSGDAKLGAHIFSVSAGLVGVCLTVIGLLHLIMQSGHVDTIADNMLALDALVFLVACLFAYLALRTRGKRAQQFERIADIAFLFGLTVMVGIAALIAYDVY